MMTKFVCETCKETKTEIWMCDGEDGKNCEMCRKKLRIKDSFCDKGHYFDKSEVKETWNGLDKCPYCHPSYDDSGAVTLNSQCPDEIAVSLNEEVLETPPVFHERTENEELLKAIDTMIDLGLDPIHAKKVYLRRWATRKVFTEQSDET